MDKKAMNWEYAVDNVFTYLNERPREFSARMMLRLVDELARRGIVTQSELISAIGDDNFIATTLSLVTMAVQTKGAINKADGWYRPTQSPLTYNVHPEFAAAWKKKRRLD